jgi:hypothetical protein
MAKGESNGFTELSYGLVGLCPRLQYRIEAEVENRRDEDRYASLLSSSSYHV